MFAAKNELLTRPSGGFVIPRSLRFRASASAYLNRTFGTPTSNTTWTLSLWLKRGRLPGGSTRNDIFSAGTEEIVFYQGTEVLYLRAGSISTAVFRDTSAWYHLVIVSNGTTVKGYINNSEVVSYTGTMTSFNSAAVHTIGQYQNNLAADGFFDGYMAEINFVDGQALATTSFGATSTITGVWSPIKYTGTYGNNGFHLDFNSYATTAALGTDTSGNSNTWTVNNCSVTAGVTYDSMIDVPTVTATGSNYAVWNPNDSCLATGAITISQGNLHVVGTGGSNEWVAGSIAIDIGGTTDYVWEVKISALVASYFGIMPASTTGVIYGTTGIRAYYPSLGKKYSDTTGTAYAASSGAGDVMGFVIGNGSITTYKNGTSLGVMFSGLTGFWKPMINHNNTFTIDANFGQQGFAYPSSYGSAKALNTYNLAAASILIGNLYMNAVTYTGTVAQVATTFSPDFFWAKTRSNVFAHGLFDSLRGTQVLESNTTAAEAFSIDAVSLGDGSSRVNLANYSGHTDQPSYTYVAWYWKAGGSTGVSNTSGSITSMVSANTTSGFSVVTYTGTGANATVGHGLGVAPRMMIIKQRSGGASSGANDWNVYHANLTSAVYYIRLNLQNAEVSNATVWNSTAPSSTVFSLGSQQNSNELNGLMVAYCFAQIAGFSAFGSYVGNGSADGTFVYTGFRPRWIMTKQTDVASEWDIIDTARDTYNLAGQGLRAQTAAAEYTPASSGFPVDILSNGFKWRGAASDPNRSGATYIYAAFAENPFNNSLAR